VSSQKELQVRVGENARRLRLAEGLTTAEAAERLRRDDRYLRRLEAGAFNVGLSTLRDLAICYGVDPSSLLKPLRSKPGKRKAGRPAARSR